MIKSTLESLHDLSNNEKNTITCIENIKDYLPKNKNTS